MLQRAKASQLKQEFTYACGVKYVVLQNKPAAALTLPSGVDPRSINHDGKRRPAANRTNINHITKD